MRRMYREDMYDTRSGEPPPLVTRDNVLEVEERVDHKGNVIAPLNESDVLRAIRELREKDIEAVGVCYLFSFRNPAHELRTKELLNEHLPDVPVSTSYEVCPEIRDFERASTTHLNAYLQPPVEKYLRDPGCVAAQTEYVRPAPGHAFLWRRHGCRGGRRKAG